MATTGHENELVKVEGLKASLQKFKSEAVDARKQDTITDLDNIRRGAALGATALQALYIKYTDTHGMIIHISNWFEPTEGSVVFLYCTNDVQGYDSAPDDEIYINHAVVLRINGKIMYIINDRGVISDISAGTVLMLVCDGSSWRVVNSFTDQLARSAYQKPEDGIPLSDLSSDVQDVINHASDLTPPNIGIAYGTCNTAASTITKQTTISGYSRTEGGYVCIHFSYDVPAGSGLKINEELITPISYKGSSILNGIIQAGDKATFVYSKGKYHLIAIDATIDILTKLRNATVVIS